ncbi:MAG TPA: GAF domain-containing sensor histidine kinase [Ktedonobacterales bacterium]|nr:GAF domain-containing sensor histidine kinase [Ktedonobacterales bacterium]
MPGYPNDPNHPNHPNHPNQRANGAYSTFGPATNNLDDQGVAAALRAEIDRLHRRNRQLEEQAHGLLTVLEGVANALSAEIDLPPLLRRIALVAIRLTGAHVGAVYLSDASGALIVEAVETAQAAAETNILSPLIAPELGQDATLMLAASGERPHLALGRGVAGWVAQTGELQLIGDAATDRRFSAQALAVDGALLGVQPGSLLVIPMVFRGGVTGVLEVAKRAETPGFDVRSLEIMRTLGAQAAVAVANAQLYQRLRSERDRIIQTQEEERKRLGMWLHDGPAQQLAQIAGTLEYAETLITRDPATGVSKALAEMRAARENAIRTTHEMRNMLFDLRPLVLDADNGGLVAALRFFLLRFNSGAGPRIRFDAYYPKRLSHNIELTTFAIIQEAVNNVLKHAHATACWIDLRESETALVATVRDDGQGFDVRQVQQEYESRGSWGMLSMHERAELLRGSLAIASQPGNGSIVTLTVPRDGANASR